MAGLALPLLLPVPLLVAANIGPHAGGIVGGLMARLRVDQGDGGDAFRKRAGQADILRVALAGSQAQGEHGGKQAGQKPSQSRLSHRSMPIDLPPSWQEFGQDASDPPLESAIHSPHMVLRWAHTHRAPL